MLAEGEGQTAWFYIEGRGKQAVSGEGRGKQGDSKEGGANRLLVEGEGPIGC